MQPGQPCWDPLQYSSASNQQFFFSELRRESRSCTTANFSYVQLGGSLAQTNEYDFHLENGLLYKLDNAEHYTYSIYPSSEVVKKEVLLNVYQRPIVNFKLECALREERNMQTIFDDLSSSDVLKTWPKLLNEMNRFGLWCLILVMIVPILSFNGTIILTPLTFITVSGMYIATLIYAVPTRDELLSFIDAS